jgi:hypothetical protein
MRSEHLVRQPSAQFGEVIEFGVKRPGAGRRRPQFDNEVANLGRWHLTLLEVGLVGVAPHAPERWAVDAFEAGGAHE